MGCKRKDEVKTSIGASITGFRRYYNRSNTVQEYLLKELHAASHFALGLLLVLLPVCRQCSDRLGATAACNRTCYQTFV